MSSSPLRSQVTPPYATVVLSHPSFTTTAACRGPKPALRCRTGLWPPADVRRTPSSHIRRHGPVTHHAICERNEPPTVLNRMIMRKISTKRKHLLGQCAKKSFATPEPTPARPFAHLLPSAGPPRPPVRRKSLSKRLLTPAPIPASLQPRVRRSRAFCARIRARFFSGRFRFSSNLRVAV